MHRSDQILLTMLVVAIILPATAQAQVPESARSPITDPVLLKSFGYPPEARNIFLRTVAPGTDEERPGRGDGLQPEEYGTDSNWNTAAAGFDFQPISNTVEYTKGPSFLTFNGALASFTDGGVFEAQLDMPQGVDWNWLDLFGWHDDASNDLVVTAIERCLGYFEAGNPTETILSTRTISDRDGHFLVDNMGINTTINNSVCTYHVRAVFGNAVGPAPGVLIQLTKTRAEWARQVSPAPPTATFGDVPTGHPFFQHIEALAASGITSGCGGGDFCPGNPLTRGQMAAFLAKALGLHWAN